MAKRKPLMVRLYQEHRKASAARERERQRAAKEFVRDQERIARELETERKAAVRAEEKQRRDAARAAELAVKAWEKERNAQQAAAMRAERERTRAAAAAERERAARAREAVKAAVEARHAEARVRTEAIRDRVAGQEKLLLERAVDLRGNAHAIGRMFDKGGPEAFAAAVDGAVAGSRYPDGVVTGVTSRFHPESRELVVHCELPRQDVVPKVVSYRYRVCEKDFRAEPRKDAEIKRLYRELDG
ncbi:MAG: hypothetical protein ACRDRO_07590 [Pseudonocardiaceae bacterium]